VSYFPSGSAMLVGIWFILCSLMVWTRRENVVIFLSFCCAVGIRYVVGFLLSDARLSSVATGFAYSCIHATLTIGMVASYVFGEGQYEGSLEYVLIVSSLGYLCMELFDKVMSGLVNDRLSFVAVNDSAILLSLLTAQFHREYRVPCVVLIYSTFIDHLFIYGRGLAEQLERLHNGKIISEATLTTLTRASKLLFLAIPRMFLVVWVFRDIVFSRGYVLRRFRGGVEFIGSALAISLLNVTALYSLLSISDSVQKQSTKIKQRKLWKIANRWFDLSTYVKRHPGGKAAILLGQGRECSALFLSYHPFTERHIKILKRFEVCKSLVEAPDFTEMPSSTAQDEAISADLTRKDPFYDDLCTRVQEVLKEKGVDGNQASASRWVYYCTITVITAVSCIGFWRGSILWTVSFAASSWLMGAMGHDASHFAISHRPWINCLCLSGMALLCSPILWLNQHTYAHHSHTNDFDRDPDMHHFPFLRTHKRTKFQNKYLAQAYRVYVWLWYLFITFGECLWLPIRSMMFESLYELCRFPGPGFGFFGWFITLLHFVGFSTVIIYTPFVSLPLASAITVVLLYLSITGIFFGVFSQINHLNEESVKKDDGKKTIGLISKNESDKNLSIRVRKLNIDSWATSQVKTSNNFCNDSIFWSVWSNGLNFQIEHHLFPGINHEYLHLIAPVVRKTCTEYGVPYKSFNSIGDISSATLLYYRRLANRDIDNTKKFT